MSTTKAPNPVLHHVNFKTNKMDALIDWYGTVIGTEIVHKFQGGAWLTNDEANHRIAILHHDGWQDDPDKIQHTGLHHTAYEYPALDDLLGTYTRLRAVGILPRMCLDHGMTMSFYYSDPDLNAVELQVDEFGAWEKSKSYMLNSPAFEENPIGVPVDPDKLVAAREAGATPQELHERSMAGGFPPSRPVDLMIPDSH
jgi:catechol 2,3-dioxygenase